MPPGGWAQPSSTVGMPLITPSGHHPPSEDQTPPRPNVPSKSQAGPLPSSPTPSPPPSPTLPPCPSTRTQPRTRGFDFVFLLSNAVPGNGPLSYGFEIPIESPGKAGRPRSSSHPVPRRGTTPQAEAAGRTLPATCSTHPLRRPFSLSATRSALPLRRLCLLSGPRDSIPRPANKCKAGPALRRSLKRGKSKLPRFWRGSSPVAAARSPRHKQPGKTRKPNAMQSKSPLPGRGWGEAHTSSPSPPGRGSG